jgi:hypothetical protein
MTHQQIHQKVGRLPTCSSGDGLLHAMALMAEHKVRKVLVRDQCDVIKGIFHLQKSGIRFETIGS